MANLFAIIIAKSVLLAVYAAWVKLSSRAAIRVLAVGITVGAVFGIAFFALFYEFVQAIDYHTPVTWRFVAVNACLSYGATAATVTLLPLDLERRQTSHSFLREAVYFSSTIAISILVLARTESQFVKAFCIGVILMSAMEIGAFVLGHSGPIARMLHGAFRPMSLLLAASAMLGLFYETLNLIFPVWDWATLAPLPIALRTTIMIAVGYIVLVHPLFVAVRLIQPPPAKSGRGADSTLIPRPID